MTMHQSADVTMEMESDQNNNNESNNNLNIKKNEKYSLRQRGQRKSIVNSKQQQQQKSEKRKVNSMSDDLMATVAATSSVAGTNMPLQFQSPVMIEKVRSTTKEKPKQKAAPLSKYRRKTANARERTRMREINHAFESLRQSVPVVVAGLPSQSTNEKLTKITTLRMAMKYIKILSDILDNKTQLNDNLLASLMAVDGDGKHVRTEQTCAAGSEEEKMVANVLASNHHDYCKEVEIVKPVKASKMTKKVTVKAKKTPTTKTRTPAKNKQLIQPLAPPVTSISTRKQATNVIQGPAASNKFIHQLINANYSNNNIKYDLSPCLTPPNDDSPSELGLILESDGESLQLSEPCFSPLEFGLLLESDGESLHLSEPCLSPLSHLDAFNDLLHGSFNEHNSLEMYLS